MMLAFTIYGTFIGSMAIFFQLRTFQCVKGTRAHYLATSWHITFSGLSVIYNITRTLLDIKMSSSWGVAFGCFGALVWMYLATSSYINHDNWYKDSFTKIKKGFKRLQEQWLPRPATV